MRTTDTPSASRTLSLIHISSLEYDCDPDKLARVFDNLLRNACHYSTPGSVVRISGGDDVSKRQVLGGVANG